MKFIRFAILLVGVPCLAQSTAELLQQGIYNQETAGNLDTAIQIYRQIVNSATNQRDLAAQAQYRLAQSLLQKGDLTNAAVEFQRLARDFPDQQAIIAKSAQNPLLRILENAKKVPRETAEFDLTKSMSITGTVTQVLWMNPVTWLTLQRPGDAAQPMRISLASPNDLVATGKWTRATVKPGDELTIMAAPALDGSATGQAMSILRPDGTEIFNRQQLQQVVDQRKEKELELRMQKLRQENLLQEKQ